jgi:hypothetical protein
MRTTAMKNFTRYPAAILSFAGVLALGRAQTIEDFIKNRGSARPRAAQQAQGKALPSGANQGFRMDLPPGWRAQLAENGAVTARSGDGASLVVVAPVLGIGEATAEWLRRRGAAALVPYLGNAAVSAVYPSRIGGSAALAAAEYSGGSGPGTANVLLYADGGIGTLYVIAGPKALFARQRAQLVQVLRSFSFTGERPAQAGAGEAPADVNFARFDDPREGAFTVQAPAGWRIEGGVARFAATDVRPYVFATSLDGSRMVRIGDPAVGLYTLPNQLFAFAGMGEGQVYSPGYGVQMTIMRYLPGHVFAQQYTAALARHAQAANLRIQSVKPLPPLHEAFQGYVQQQMTAGEAAFTCVRNGRECAGSVVSETTLTAVPASQGGMWQATALASFLAPVESAGPTNRILLHMVESFQMNPQWLQAQSQTAMNTAQIARTAALHTSRIINDVYWNRQAAQDRVNQKWDDYIRGVVRLRDPRTGEQFEGSAGRNHYYRVDGNGRPDYRGNHVIGQDRARNVDIGELEVVP